MRTILPPFRLRPLGRLAFVLRTTALVLLAYLALRLLTWPVQGFLHGLPGGWQFLDPLGLLGGETPGDRAILAVHATLAFGLLFLGMRRARDAGWPAWTGALLALPLVRLFLFPALAIAPARHHTSVLDLPTNSLLERLMPRSRRGSAVTAVLLTLLLALPLGILNVDVLEQYGITLFVGLPFIMGALSAYLYSYHRSRTLRQSIGIALTTVTFALVLLFLLAMEGVVCLIMAAPLAYAIACTGAVMGHALGSSRVGSGPVVWMLLLFTPSIMGFEAAVKGRPPLFKVVTTIRVDAPPEQVWGHLVAFTRMGGPEELLFRAGISYPIEARIQGSGAGACRYCEFNTGAFVEPITTWDAPHLLAFDVKDFPPPMTELSIYSHVNAPHIHGFFRSRRGQFRLQALPDGGTLLEGTTWYTHDIWPTWYWRLWSDHILHRIHERVLLHIKATCEDRPPGTTGGAATGQ